MKTLSEYMEHEIPQHVYKLADRLQTCDYELDSEVAYYQSQVMWLSQTESDILYLILLDEHADLGTILNFIDLP